MLYKILQRSVRISCRIFTARENPFLHFPHTYMLMFFVLIDKAAGGFYVVVIREP